MNFTDKLDRLMEERNITRGGLARQSGIPYTTIVGFYDKGYENIKLSNLKKLAEFFGVSIEYLCNDDIDAYGEEDGDDVARRLVKLVSALPQEQRAQTVETIRQIMELFGRIDSRKKTGA